MPRRQTDVPHTSTTNHLIAIYENGQMRGSPAQQPKKTTPVLDGRLDSIAPDPPSTSVALRRHTIAAAIWCLRNKRGSGGETLQRIAKTVGDADEELLLRQLREVVAAYPDDPYVLVMMADVAHAAAMVSRDPKRKLLLFELAIPSAQKVLALQPKQTEERIVAHLVLANLAISDSNFPNAARHLRQLVTLRRSPDDWQNLGMCYSRMRKPKSAVAAFNQAIKIQPANPQLYGLLSQAYRESGMPTEALQVQEYAQQVTGSF